MIGPHDWLDKHIAEQAAYCGLSVEDHAQAMADLCEAQEQHENEEG